MINLGHLTEDELILEMQKRGFLLFREYFKWGKTLGFKNYATNEILFNDHGRMLNPTEMLQDLKENWEPQADEEVRYKMFSMEAQFEQFFIKGEQK